MQEQSRVDVEQLLAQADALMAQVLRKQGKHAAEQIDAESAAPKQAACMHAMLLLSWHAPLLSWHQWSHGFKPLHA